MTKNWPYKKESLVFIQSLGNEKFPDAPSLRAKLGPVLKFYLATERQKAEEALLKNKNGLACAKNLSAIMDTVIYAIHAAVLEKLFASRIEEALHSVSILATGGYGRATLAPFSDIDLLFVLSDENRALGEEITEAILYILWDLKLKVGQAVRQVDESLQDSVNDYTIRTALLEARWLTGNEALFSALMSRFEHEVVKLSVSEFVDAKLQERDQRIEKAGESRYLLEPHIKDGKGGLRDLHSLGWIFRYISLAKQQPYEKVRNELMASREAKLFSRCENFLWNIRCHMHFITGRAEERLTFDLQRNISARLGYADRPNFSAVERFMKSYYLVAKDVGVLTVYFCAELEAQHVKKTPQLERASGKRTGRPQPKRAFLNDPYFIRENGRLTIKREDTFMAYPINIIRMFWLADRYYIPLHPEALYQARQARKRIDRSLRLNRDANEYFMDILTSRTVPEKVLRLMNDTGVLGQFIPEFGHIVGMMQFNMYHSYTVDEHTLYTIGALNDLENGLVPEAEGRALSLTEEERRELYMAAFLHDIAKGGKEDHSVAGAAIARKLGPRFGLTEEEIDTVTWLVEHHMIMSSVAQRRDLGDPATIMSFADIVQSRERLKLLYLLTIADIKAVGPTVWTPWKGQLLSTLYSETALVLGGGSPESLHARKLHAQNALRRLLPNWSDEEWEHYLQHHSSSYWVKGDALRHKEHAELIRRAENSERDHACQASLDAAHGITRISVYAPDHPGLLSFIAGACAASDANIIGAQVFTTLHHYGLATVTLAKTFEDKADELRRANRIIATLEKVFEGTLAISSLIQEKKQRKGRLKAFNVPIRVRINNTGSDKQTILEVSGLDRPGLLYELTKVISEFDILIASAHISTLGEKVIDSFYVTTDRHKKVEDEHQILLLKQTLSSVLSA